MHSLGVICIWDQEVTPFSQIEKWYEEGKYMPYTDKDPNLLLELLVRLRNAASFCGSSLLLSASFQLTSRGIS